MYSHSLFPHPTQFQLIPAGVIVRTIVVFFFISPVILLFLTAPATQTPQLLFAFSIRLILVSFAQTISIFALKGVFFFQAITLRVVSSIEQPFLTIIYVFFLRFPFAYFPLIISAFLSRFSFFQTIFFAIRQVFLFLMLLSFLSQSDAVLPLASSSPIVFSAIQPLVQVSFISPLAIFSSIHVLQFLSPSQLKLRDASLISINLLFFVILQPPSSINLLLTFAIPFSLVIIVTIFVQVILLSLASLAIEGVYATPIFLFFIFTPFLFHHPILFQSAIVRQSLPVISSASFPPLPQQLTREQFSSCQPHTFSKTIQHQQLVRHHRKLMLLIQELYHHQTPYQEAQAPPDWQTQPLFHFSPST